MTDPERKERIRKAADRFATALAWRIFGPPIIVTGILAAGFLILLILILTGLIR